VVQAFDGVNALTTPAFQVQDKWEVRWDCPDVIAITLLSPDGTIVAGASGSLKGSLFNPGRKLHSSGGPGTGGGKRPVARLVVGDRFRNGGEWNDARPTTFRLQRFPLRVQPTRFGSGPARDPGFRPSGRLVNECRAR